MKCFLKAKFSRIYSTHGSWYTFQIVVDDDELEMWLEWLENHEMGFDSNWRSCWHRFHGGGRCAERAWNLSLSWSAVLVYTSARGSYQHVLVTLIMENALESRACRHGTDSRCRLGYQLQGQASWDPKSQSTAVFTNMLFDAQATSTRCLDLFTDLHCAEEDDAAFFVMPCVEGNPITMWRRDANTHTHTHLPPVCFLVCCVLSCLGSSWHSHLRARYWYCRVNK